jgi:hypothetical protein
MYFLSKLSAEVDCRTVLFRSGILAEILAAIRNSNLDPLPSLAKPKADINRASKKFSTYQLPIFLKIAIVFECSLLK